MNESIETLVNECVPETDPELREKLKAALLERDEAICDLLRITAAANGLRPSFVALALLTVGLGEKPSPEQVALLQQQVHREQAEAGAQYQEFIRRVQQGEIDP